MSDLLHTHRVPSLRCGDTTVRTAQHVQDQGGPKRSFQKGKHMNSGKFGTRRNRQSIFPPSCNHHQEVERFTGYKGAKSQKSISVELFPRGCSQERPKCINMWSRCYLNLHDLQIKNKNQSCWWQLATGVKSRDDSACCFFPNFMSCLPSGCL